MTYDSRIQGGEFQVNTTGGIVKFKPYKNGLNYLVMSPDKSSTKTLVVLVRDNLEGFTKNEIEEAIKDQEIQAMLGHPSRHDFKNMVHAKLITNYPISQNTITNADVIFGDNLTGQR